MTSKSHDRQFSSRFERVLDEAEEIFIHEGFLHLSTDELAQRLRCSKRTLYAIAPVREKFFEVVVTRRGVRFRQNMIAAMQRASGVQEAITVGIDICVSNARNTSVMWQRDLGRFPAGIKALKQWKTDVRKVLEELIERGIRESLVRKVEPRVAAEALLVSVLRVSETEFLADSRTTSAEAVSQLYTIFWHGLSRDRKRSDRRMLAALTDMQDRHADAPSKLSPVFKTPIVRKATGRRGFSDKSHD